MNIRVIRALALFALGVAPASSYAAGTYDPGASDTEIVIGNTSPYSGPASAYGMVGRVQDAYFRMLNDNGGIHGRKIRFISYDDSYSPPKTVEQTRKLVESDNVLFIFSSVGTPTSLAVQKYMNGKKVPQVFVASGSSRWGDYKEFPWSIGHQVSFLTEGRIFGKHIGQTLPGKTIGVIYQNDDVGKELLRGLKEGLGSAASAIVAETPAEIADPTVDAQVIKIKSANPDIFVHFTSPKAATQTLRKIAELGWKPIQFVDKISASNAAVMKPAGYENVQGLYSVTYQKEYSDAEWKNDPAMTEFGAFMKKYMPDVDPGNSFALAGYIAAQTLRVALEQCGDNLTRENIMAQATNLRNLELGTLLPGIRINTSKTDYFPLEELQFMKFEGQEWKRFGPVVSGTME